jgi:hypothetical protein
MFPDRERRIPALVGEAPIREPKAQDPFLDENLWSDAVRAKGRSLLPETGAHRLPLDGDCETSGSRRSVLRQTSNWFNPSTVRLLAPSGKDLAWPMCVDGPSWRALFCRLPALCRAIVPQRRSCRLKTGSVGCVMAPTSAPGKRWNWPFRPVTILRLAPCPPGRGALGRVQGARCVARRGKAEDACGLGKRL